jgi:uncharacterized membrane protein YccC
LLLRLETGDQLFGAFVALSDLMDDDGAPAARAAGQRLARRLAPLLGVLARSMLSDRPPRKRSVERVLAQALVDSASDPAVHAITKTIVDRLSVALRLFSPDKSSFGDPSVRQRTSGSWHERMIDPLRANLTWNSAVLRHALRAAVVAIPALVITLLWQGAFTHWLTITVVLTLQPYYGATWQRALERIAGTVLGGLAGALLVHAASSPVALAALMFPLCILGFSARRVSYGAFIGCLMPQLVVLVEFIRPGYSSWDIVEMRVLFTLIGGAIAVAGCLMLWPSWERNRIRREVNAALGDLGLYADAVFGTILNEAMPRTINEYRRQAGLALNNLEASIARALQEPGQNRRTRLKLEQVMIADATLRRLGGRLSVLQHDPNSRRALATDIGRQWRTWIKDAISAVRRGKPIAPKPSDDVELESLSRIARQIELLAGALDPVAHDGRHQPGQRQAQER